MQKITDIPWLVSGAMHYFRIPRELWRDRIRKARACGLNCIETYVSWNLHEPRPGEYDFSGRLDLDAWLRMIADEGLYVFMRPGPYICSEWDNGALPAWLTAIPGIRVRENDPVYLKAVDRWLGKLIPILARNQATRGGNVVLVQNENEYFFPDRPGGKEYLEHLSRKFRELGIEVPISVCNHLKLPIPDTLETWNAWDALTEGIATLRKAQPKGLKMISEFWVGWFTVHGDAGIDHRVPHTVFRRCFEILGNAATWNYYMFHGGTNFGYLAGRSNPHSMAAIIASYDFGAPLSEAGEIKEKYNVVKIANWWSRRHAEFLSEAHLSIPAVAAPENVRVQELTGPRGRMWFVRSATDELPKEPITLEPMGCGGTSEAESFSVDLSDLGAAALPMGFEYAPGLRVDFANCTVWDWTTEGSRPSLLVFAPAGFAGTLIVNGERIEFTFPEGIDPLPIERDGVVLVALSTEGAKRCWLTEKPGDWTVGPWYLGDSEEEGLNVALEKANREIVRIVAGQPRYIEIEAPLNGPPELPALSEWTETRAFPELEDKKIEWRPLDGSQPMERLGDPYGYGWYRLDVDSKHDEQSTLYFPEAGDRLLVFQDGKYIGTWGRGEGATEDLLPVTLKKGRNRFVFLADNMGRPNFGRKVGEYKGIYGPIWKGIEPVPLPEPETLPEKRNDCPRGFENVWAWKSLWNYTPGPVRSRVLEVELGADEFLHLSIRHAPDFVYIYINGEPVEYLSGMPGCFSDLGYREFPLRKYCRPGKNRLEILAYGEQNAWRTEEMALYRVSGKSFLKGTWAYRSFTHAPGAEGSADPSHPLRWYVTKFKWSGDTSLPVFLKLPTRGKGHVYLNGEPMGRYWSIGPQDRFYLPEVWLEEENEIALFEERGVRPEGAHLCRGPIEEERELFRGRLEPFE